MAAILDSLGFTFLIDRMTEVLTPDIYIELTGVVIEMASFCLKIRHVFADTSLKRLFRWPQEWQNVTEQRFY
jgi:hypothetical protein